MLKDGFSTREVLELTGTTARQLQWWDEKRIIVPKRDGRFRLYSAEDLIEIQVIEEMRRRHISLGVVRRVMRFLRRETGQRLAQLVSGESDWHLLLDGRNLYLETDARQIVSLIRNTVQPVFVICLSEAVRRLEVTLPGRDGILSPAKKPPMRAGVRKSRREGKERAG